MPGVELHIFPGHDGAFQLYEDAGDGYDYEQGALHDHRHSLGWTTPVA